MPIAPFWMKHFHINDQTQASRIFRIGHFEEFPAPSCGAGRQDSSNHRKNYLFCWMRDPELYPYKPFICHWHPGRKRESQMTSTYYKACYSALVREFQYERQPTRFSNIVSIPTFSFLLGDALRSTIFTFSDWNLPHSLTYSEDEDDSLRKCMHYTNPR